MAAEVKGEYGAALNYAASIIERCCQERKIYAYGKLACSQNEDWCQSHIDLIDRILMREPPKCYHCGDELMYDEIEQRLFCPCGYIGEKAKNLDDAIYKYNEK